MLSIIKQLEAESTLVHEVYSLLAVRLKALLSQWTDASVTSFGGEVDCMLDIVDEEKRLYAVNSFHEYYGAVAEKWSQTVQRNIADDLQYTSDSFWYWVQIVNPNVKAELPHMFEIYKHLFTLVVQRGHDITQLEREFLAYQAYVVKEIVEPLQFWRMHARDWPTLSRCALDLLGLPISSANVERAFSMFRVVSRKERAAVTDTNIGKYACIYYNKL